MQLLETSVLGLRSATHELHSEIFNARVTVFPMVHIGEAAFYTQVYQGAADHDLILLEGVHSKTVRNLTRAYRWLPLKRYGLVCQPKFDKATAKGEVRGADLTATEYDALWRQIPRLRRLHLTVIAPLFGLIGRLFLTKSMIAKHLGLDDLTSRSDVLAQGADVLSVTDVIDAERDAKACRILEAAIQKSGDQDISIAVIYGARHMPVILRFLGELGQYRPLKSKWKTVFEV